MQQVVKKLRDSVADTPAACTPTLPVSLKPLGPFDFRHPHEWPKRKCRLCQYLTVTALDRDDDTRKISTLLNCMGEDGEDVLTSTNISADEKEEYESVIWNSSQSKETSSLNEQT